LDLNAVVVSFIEIDLITPLSPFAPSGPECVSLVRRMRHPMNGHDRIAVMIIADKYYSGCRDDQQ